LLKVGTSPAYAIVEKGCGSAREHFRSLSIAQLKVARELLDSIAEAMLCTVGRESQQRKHR
jgi:hypothetical protein